MRTVVVVLVKDFLTSMATLVGNVLVSDINYMCSIIIESLINIGLSSQ